MLFTRREVGKIALGAGTVASVAGMKPDSKFGGVQVGVITYSFRALPDGAKEVLGYCLECGLSGIELMSWTPEGYAGAPERPPRRRRGSPWTEAQEAARLKAVDDLKRWRLSVSMDKYKAFRRMYEDAGVKIYAFKLPPTMDMSGEEYEYIWNVAETLGADHVTMELPTDDGLLERVASYAAKRKLHIAFHTHGQGGASGFDKVLAASGYTALNFDVGHYYGVNGESPVPIVEKYHDRIASLHLKDRKGPESAGPGGAHRGGANVPWGEGGTPLKETLQLMRKRGYRFPASIEYEYQTPEGSDVLTEIKKCVRYCKQALL